MKVYIFSFFLIFSLVPFPVKLGDISNAIKQGNADILSKYFCDDLEVYFQEEGDLYSKNEAKEIIGNFFKKSAPKTYTEMHDGSSKGAGGKYAIGLLETSSDNYRVSIYLEKVSSDYLIREIRFIKE